MNNKKYKKAYIFPAAPALNQVIQPCSGLSEQKQRELSTIEHEITSIRIALTSIELAIKKIRE